jgi:transcription elongation factor Elf1
MIKLSITHDMHDITCPHCGAQFVVFNVIDTESDQVLIECAVCHCPMCGKYTGDEK